MKIAAITITYNDGYKFKEWCEHYESYKSELYKHIIVDNGSLQGYLQEVKAYFKESVIIERTSNGGTTGAYNDGIRKALEDANVDAIMLIMTDVKLQNGSATTLYNYLYSDDKLGMVGTILLKKDSNIIECYGVNITKYGRKTYCNENENINKVHDSFRIVSYVMGGMNLSKREYYEKVGLQDEKLFMYGDERDNSIRANKLGYKLGVTKEAISWHQHINIKGREFRLPFVCFLIARNYVYLAKKHYSILHTIVETFYHFFIQTLHFIWKIHKKSIREGYYYHCRGYIAGLRGNMDNTFMH
jgi:GT2 family glycosyltransferase